jgi:hypothetical protein
VNSRCFFLFTTSSFKGTVNNNEFTSLAVFATTNIIFAPLNNVVSSTYLTYLLNDLDIGRGLKFRTKFGNFIQKLNVVVNVTLLGLKFFNFNQQPECSINDFA